MRPGRGNSASTVRLYALYGGISLVAVLVFGAVLAVSLRGEARRRGAAEGASEATLVAQTAVEPLLDGRPLSEGLTPVERQGLQRLVIGAVSAHEVLRLRLRTLTGRVAFSDDGSGYFGPPEDNALDAARGRTIALPTHLNADRNDRGPAGPSSVEVYLPLKAGIPPHLVGVFEVYLPYAPITRDIANGLRMLYWTLAIGLALLWLALFGIALSVSRAMRREMALNTFMAEHDILTGLPNRLLFHRRVDSAVRTAQRRGQRVGIAIIDLDRFKEINDTLGHQNGDRLLTALASRFRDHMRPGDTVARLGGDEFGVILREFGDRTETMLWELRGVIGAEIEIDGVPLSVEASIGFVVAPEDRGGADHLLQRADVAMYVAKARHAGVVRYDVEHDHYDAADLALVAQLRHAIDAGELVLHYQPKSALADGRIEAVEALVRWQHPHLGLLAPARFLPLAEQTELIDKLTTWVLNQALSELRDIGALQTGLSVAVNVSARNLGQHDFAKQVVGTLDRLAIPASSLIIEITETALLTDPPRAAALLAELADAGIRVSLDDFGCGQTSFGYLSALPIHELKIDKSFVSDMRVNPSHAAIVRSIVDLGHNLSLRVVGEGVETTATLQSLRDTGCDVAQGYVLARPMPITDLGAFLASGRRPATSPDVQRGASDPSATPAYRTGATSAQL